MNRSFQYTALLLVSFSILLFGCGGKVESPQGSGQPPMAQINCIAVLPTAFQPSNSVVPVYMPKEDSELQGIQSLNEILSDELGGKEGVRFVSLEQISSLSLTGGEDQLALARMVGNKMKCNAVLESIVSRFKKRDGGRYSVESPASVAFVMRLIEIESGAVLWSAKFDESQKSVMENILEFKKANTRGFVWITANELMREGVQTKLAESPYFKPGGN